ncbi:MAG: endonuclease domain-containing protein [Chitinophagaceae bacterium]|nr:MAG: endonuclease domain-containing protein [Chitinophagaceae bacterium]
MPPNRQAHTPATYRRYRTRLTYARENRRQPTEAEKLLWEALRNHRLGGYKFRRQHIIGIHIVDFICIQWSLIVEVDGEIHNQGENPQLDKSREADLRAAGYELLRFTNDEVINNLDLVCITILRRLRGFAE